MPLGGETMTALVRSLSRSRGAAVIAARVRNQANRVIGYHHSPSFDVEENGEMWLQRTVASEVRTFIDVGANVGDWTAALVARAPEAHGILFEPSKPLAAQLRERFSGNDRLKIMTSAVSDRAGRMMFFDEGDGSETSSLVPRNFTTVDEHMVDVVTVDEVLQSEGVEQLDLLKIDAEGFDYRVLYGSQSAIRQRRIAVVQFEYNNTWLDGGGTLTAAYRLFESAGYTVRILRRDGAEPFDLARFGDYFSYANFVAAAPGIPLG
jgi:FkbM family methyltransferase